MDYGVIGTNTSRKHKRKPVFIGYVEAGEHGGSSVVKS